MGDLGCCSSRHQPEGSACSFGARDAGICCAGSKTHAMRSSKARSFHGQAKPNSGNSCASLLRPQQTRTAQRKRKRKEEKEEIFKILAGVQNLEETCPETDVRWGDQLSLS